MYTWGPIQRSVAGGSSFTTIFLTHNDAQPYINEVTGSAVTVSINGPTMELTTGKFSSGARTATGYSRTYSRENVSHTFSSDMTLEYQIARPGGFGVLDGSNLWSTSFIVQFDDGSFVQFSEGNFSSSGLFAGFTLESDTEYFELSEYKWTNSDFHHIAITLSGSIAKFYIDGVLAVTQSFASWNLTGRLATRVYFNYASNTVVLDEIRVCDGLVYTADFTPPSAPFTI